MNKTLGSSRSVTRQTGKIQFTAEFLELLAHLCALYALEDQNFPSLSDVKLFPNQLELQQAPKLRFFSN